MGQLIVDRDWWNKLPKKEQARILELVNQDAYVGRAEVAKQARTVSKLYTNVHH